MPAIPVLPNGAHLAAPSEEFARKLGSQEIFERGDHVYLTTPVQVFRPSDDQIEEYAFSKALKTQAPNDNLVWFKGQYVEADNANGNGAMWKAQELAIKSLTPMLMPVTVMHDPRTAVGTIADVKMLTPEADGVPRARIETVLALWGHRFPEAVQEAEVNAARGTLMQSMECFSPWYECSSCGQVFHKLPRGAEQAQWCDHLKASNPSAGYMDLGSQGQSSNASRILGDVTFTGTGLIFGTRGARGAYSEAFLQNFEDEVANHHHTVHTSTATTSEEQNPMGLVQIEQSELDTLRKERDDARAEKAAEQTKREEAERAVEATEAAKLAAEEAKAAAEAKVTELEEQANKVALKDGRVKELGPGFVAKLGDFTKGRLMEQAGQLSDDDWENRLKELEEVTAVKRDADKDGDPNGDAQGDTFGREELARLGSGAGDPAKGPSRDEQRSVIGSLAGAFKA
jgi:hypothetical protein